MLDIFNFINLVLEKKKMTRMDFCREINKVEAKLGKARTRKENISNFLNNKEMPRLETLIKYEFALGLESFTLIKLSGLKYNREKKKELLELIERIKGGN